MSSTDIAGNLKQTNDCCNPFRHAGTPSPPPFVKGQKWVLSQLGKKRYLGKWVYAPHPQVRVKTSCCFCQLCKGDNWTSGPVLRKLDKWQTWLYKTKFVHKLTFKILLSSILDQFTECWLRTLSLFFTYFLHRESDSISYELISSHSTNS